jgi:hypothetical protein
MDSPSFYLLNVQSINTTDDSIKYAFDELWANSWAVYIGYFTSKFSQLLPAKKCPQAHGCESLGTVYSKSFTAIAAIG